jgi:predicted branched-subunit amino acid permease
MATYAKLLSLLGVSVGLTEFQHSLLLAFAITVSVLVSAWRSWRARRAWPVALALLGSALVLTGHLHGELHTVEWSGVLVLLVSGVFEQLRMPRLRLRPDAHPRQASS